MKKALKYAKATALPVLTAKLWSATKGPRDEIERRVKRGFAEVKRGWVERREASE